MTRTRISIVLLFCMLAVSLSGVAAGGGTHEGWWSSTTRHISNVMPWNWNKLGHDYHETQQKIEEIYTRSHEEAQRRVDELKEHMLKGDQDVQKRIAEIYHESLVDAERQVEALKHPMLEWLTHWRSKSGAATAAAGAASAASAVKGAADSAYSAATAAGEKAKPLADKARHEVEELSRKVSQGYRHALEQAKQAVTSVTPGATWEETKHKAADLYSEAFHKGHGSSRTAFGRFRDSLGRGLHTVAHTASTVACETWHWMSHMAMAVLYGVAGMVLGYLGLGWWHRRQFWSQLNTPISGPVVCIGQYSTLSTTSENQRKIIDFWSGPAAAYFGRQPGLRKQWICRGIGRQADHWVSYSEWATIDDLRRTLRSAEWAEIKRRAPPAVCSDIKLYQANKEIDSDVREGGVSAGLRQRQASQTAT